MISNVGSDIICGLYMREGETLAYTLNFFLNKLV